MKLEFLNEFSVKEPENGFDIYRVNYDPRYGDERKFGYKAVAQLARRLSLESDTPVASLGTSLVVPKGFKIPGKVTLTMKLEGIPTEVELVVSKGKPIDRGEERFPEAAKKFLNRKIDLLFIKKNYSQDGRCFFEEGIHPLRRTYGYQQGLYASARIGSHGTQSIIIDPVTRVRNKSNLLQALTEEVAKKGYKHWSEALESQEEINRRFRTKGLSIRSLYEEQKGDDVGRNTYQFIGFDLTKPLRKDMDPKSPVNFHRSFNRRFSMDQPEIRLKAKGGFVVSHIPELLEEVPSSHMLKRRGVSEDMQARSQMDASSRYFMTHELLKPLVQGGLVDPTPLIVSTRYFGPVRLTLSDDYIELKSNLDYQKIFDKKKLLKPPIVSKFHVFSTTSNRQKAQRLVALLAKVFEEFELTLPEPCEHYDCPDNVERFRQKVLAVADKESFGGGDLALAVFSFDEDPEDIVYDSFKQASLNRLFPLQFVDPRHLDKRRSDDEIKTDLANPLFLQIVAKCRGQPYGLQTGFAKIGAVFVGVDKYRDPFRKDAPLVTSTVIFDGEGSYICSSAVLTPSIQGSLSLKPILQDCFRRFEELTGKRQIGFIIFFHDTGIGTMREQLLADAKDCEEIASKYRAEYAVVAANKSSGLRVYNGDPFDELSARRVSSFSAVTEMRDESEILVVSTEPIIVPKKAKELGTPRPVLYTVLAHKSRDPLGKLKETISRIAVWLCKHPWISPASTRLPVPLYFANKLSKLASATGSPLKPSDSEAPLYL